MGSERSRHLLRRPVLGARSRFGAGLHGDAERAELPAAAVEASLGCGNPLMVADLQVGETVLDLGSGGGIDVLHSARRVGPTGKAYGPDMTPEMLELRPGGRVGVSDVVAKITLPDSSAANAGTGSAASLVPSPSRSTNRD